MFRITIVFSIAMLSIVIAASGFTLADQGDNKIALVRDGKPCATIVMAERPTKPVQLAAAELQYHVEKITGAKLPIVSDTATVEGNRILVGESKATGVLGLHNKDFKHQEYLVRCQPGLIVLMGKDEEDHSKLDYADADTFPDLCSEQGTCYAVYDFLEKFCDVRWYLPTELGLVCPKSDTLEVQGAEIRRAPHMKYRWITDRAYPADLCGETVLLAEPTEALSRREQALFWHRHRLGGMKYWCAHSFGSYYERFLSTHPEWFAQGYEGEPPQVCYSNPELLQQVIQDARDYFDGKGDDPGWMGDSFAIVPMDNTAMCQCPNCRAVIGDKGATRGIGQFSNDRISNYHFGFVNAVAKEIKKSHPDKFISTLAYSDYAYPPTDIKLEPNISIQLCLHARNMYLPVMPTVDQEMIDTWVAESKDRPKLLWLYYCFPSYMGAQLNNFRCFPGFFAHTIVDQMQGYREAGFSGIFYEPSYIANDQSSPLLDQLEFYVTWKLADDPTLDGNALIDEFFERYYGSAAEPMKAFYELIEQTYANPDNYPPGFDDHQSEEVAWKYLGTQSRMDQLGQFMEQARAAAKTEGEKQRVALFNKGIWQYMLAGRKAYLERQ